MPSETNPEGSRRNTVLRNFLSHLREKELARVQELRRDQASDALSDPRDTLEDARVAEELELHADLIARSEDRLAAIHAAFERLDANKYGICTKCKREIELSRIRALPFAQYCANCERIHGPERIEGTVSDEFMNRWNVPEGMVESLGREDLLELPEVNPSEVAGETLIPAPPATPSPVKRSPRPPKRRKR
jgi:DnaK suppressor protein